MGAALSPTKKCNLEFYEEYGTELFDLVNFPLYFLAYWQFQQFSIWGQMIKAAQSVALFIKYFYLSFRNMYRAWGTDLYAT